MSLWYCPKCNNINPNGDYHCPVCRTPMSYAVIGDTLLMPKEGPSPQLPADDPLQPKPETMIAPLERSDDPEQDIVCRINHAQDYILCTIAAYEQELRTANAKGRKEVEAQLATLQAALIAQRNEGKGYGVDDPLCWCAVNSGFNLPHTPECQQAKAALTDLLPSSDTETR